MSMFSKIKPDNYKSATIRPFTKETANTKISPPKKIVLPPRLHISPPLLVTKNICVSELINVDIRAASRFPSVI